MDEDDDAAPDERILSYPQLAPWRQHNFLKARPAQRTDRHSTTS